MGFEALGEVGSTVMCLGCTQSSTPRMLDEDASVTEYTRLTIIEPSDALPIKPGLRV